MKKTGYLVLSVSDIRKLLKKAEADRKANREQASWCIVIRGIDLDERLPLPNGDSIQICSHDVVNNFKP